MSNSSLLNIELSQIKLFLVAGEMRSFSRAGEIMHMEQSTVSRRIALMEQDLGFALFDRKAKPTKLTRKGEMLYEHWKPLLSAFEHSFTLINAQRDDTVTTLSVGMVDSVSDLDQATVLSAQMREIFPHVTVTFRYSPMSAWPKQLIDGVTDIAVTAMFDASDFGDDYVISELLTVPKLVCMLKTNPLAQKEQITYADLENQKFISIDDSESPRHAQFIRRICHKHGFEPQIGRRSSNAHGLTSMLQCDDEVLVCDRFLRGYDNPMFKIFELPETYSGLCAIYSKQNKSPYIQTYVKLLRMFYNKPD